MGGVLSEVGGERVVVRFAVDGVARVRVVVGVRWW